MDGLCKDLPMTARRQLFALQLAAAGTANWATKNTMAAVKRRMLTLGNMDRNQDKIVRVAQSSSSASMTEPVELEDRTKYKNLAMATGSCYPHRQGHLDMHMVWVIQTGPVAWVGCRFSSSPVASIPIYVLRLVTCTDLWKWVSWLPSSLQSFIAASYCCQHPACPPYHPHRRRRFTSPAALLHFTQGPDFTGLKLPVGTVFLPGIIFCSGHP